MANFVPECGFFGTIAFDVGSTVTRAGFAGDDTPQVLFPSTVCEWTEGEDGAARCGVLERCDDARANAKAVRTARTHPVLDRGRGEVDEGVFRLLLDHGLRRLGCTSWADHPVVLAEPIDAPASARRRTAELMFEELGVPALCICRSAELVTIQSGRPTAMVVEMGASAASAAAVCDGAVVARSVVTAKRLGGASMARSYLAVLNEAKHNLGELAKLAAPEGCHESFAEMRQAEMARELFEATCGCPSHSAIHVHTGAGGRGSGRGRGGVRRELPKGAPAEYTLPDGRSLVIGAERFALADHQIFSSQQPKPPAPAAAGQPPSPPPKPTPSLHQLVLSSLHAVDPEMHKELVRNVVLSGGVSCMLGLPERFEEELRAACTASGVAPTIANQSHRMTVFAGAPHERKFGAWLGASILGCMDLRAVDGMWMSREEYDEYGSTLICRKGMNHAW